MKDGGMREECSSRLLLIFEKQMVLMGPRGKHLHRVFSETFDQETKDKERVLLLYSSLKKKFKNLYNTFFIFGS